MDPHKSEGPQPFISQQERPDLTIDLNKKIGDLTVRELQTLLGGGASPDKLKELAKEKEDLIDKIPTKDRKDNKDHKDPKDHKDQKDNKDHKDPKDPKDTKDNKDSKDSKDQKDQKDKDPKDPKDPKDNKDHKDPKEHKDEKDAKDRKENKEGLLEKVPHKDQLEKLPEIGGKGTSEGTSKPNPVPGLEDLIRRVSGLEKEVQDLKGSGRGPGG
jgi:hypothetical protein